MRFTVSSSIRAAAVIGLLGLGIGVAVIGSQERQAIRHQLTGTKAALDLPEAGPAEDIGLAGWRPTADSALEDEAAGPVQTVIEAEQGDTLLDLLTRAGVERTDATHAIDALRGVYNPRGLKTGEEVTISFQRPADRIGTGPFLAVGLQTESGRQIVATRNGSGFTASETSRPVTRQLSHFSGTIKGSLFETASTNGVPPQILVELIHAFSYDVDFQRDIQPGDQFEVMFERQIDSRGRVVKDGAIVYASLTLSGEVMPIYRFIDAQGHADYYNAKGESIRKALLRTPVDGARISSGFGMRMHPILGFTKLHKGVDFAVVSGTPVMAAGAGTVEFAGRNGSYGNYLRIRHDAEHATAYAHLSRFPKGVHVGVHVSQGQVVAFSGASGRATGPHLHYEVLVHNAQVNPMSVKFQAGTQLAGKELGRFQAMMRDSKQWLAQTPVTSRVALNKGGDKAD